MVQTRSQFVKIPVYACVSDPANISNLKTEAFVSTLPTSIPTSSCNLESTFGELTTAFCKAGLSSGSSEEEDSSNGTPVFLVEILQHFPDLPTFIAHSQFPTFSRLWLSFQQYIAMAREPENRANIQTCLLHSIAEAGHAMISIACSHLLPNNVFEVISRSMFSAFRQLKGYMELVYEVFQIIENGRVWFNQNPLQAIAPLIDNLIKSKQGTETSPTLIQDNLATNKTPMRTLPGQKKAKCEDYVKQENDSIPFGRAPLTDCAHQQTDGPSNLLFRIDPTFLHYVGENKYLLSLENYPHTDADQNGASISSLADSDSDTVFKREYEFEEYIVDMGGADDDEIMYSAQSKKEKAKKHNLRARGYISRQCTKRTATSYDERTTHYLKTIFYDIYSVQNRLTREQRKQIEKETGLKPRNITYWFSNHKRRFQHALAEFKQTVKDSNGQVKTYDDFLRWTDGHNHK